MEGTPYCAAGLAAQSQNFPFISIRTAGPIAKILFSALLLFLEGLGSQAIRWGREMGRKARIAAAWESERWSRFLNDGSIALFLLMLA